MADFPQIVVEHNIGNTITIPNQLDVKVSTYLSDNKIVGTTVLPVDNATGFTSGIGLLMLSSLGSQSAEIVYAISHTTNSINISATLLAHSRGDIVSELNYDQVVVYKCATIDGSYSVLSTSTFPTEHSHLRCCWFNNYVLQIEVEKFYYWKSF